MRKVAQFLREAKAELDKVVWPNRRKAVRLTIMVVIVTALFGAFIGAVDYGLGKGVKYIIDTAEKKSTPAPAAGNPAGGGVGQGAPVQVPVGGGQPGQ